MYNMYMSEATDKSESLSILSRALLGLIAAEPMSGYGLTRLFERTIGRAWRAQHSQIYPTLATLEDAEMIRVVEQGRDSGRRTQ